MKKIIVTVAAAIALSAPMTVLAMDHDHMNMGHDHGMMSMGNVAHEEVVNGVKATFEVISMKEKMKGMEMPAGMKETHHIMVVFKDAKTGKPRSEGQVKMTVVGPDKAEQTKDLMAMEGGFGADFNMSKKGKYGVMCKFKLKDGNVRTSKFWYTVK